MYWSDINQGWSGNDGHASIQTQRWWQRCTSCYLWKTGLNPRVFAEHRRRWLLRQWRPSHQYLNLFLSGKGKTISRWGLIPITESLLTWKINGFSTRPPTNNWNLFLLRKEKMVSGWGFPPRTESLLVWKRKIRFGRRPTTNNWNFAYLEEEKWFWDEASL